MAFAIVAFLFVIAWAVTPSQKWPWSTNVVRETNNRNMAQEFGDVSVCTAEAKQCPDGSYVFPFGPTCEFTACPGTTTNTSTNINASGSWVSYVDPLHSYSLEYPSGWNVDVGNNQSLVEFISPNPAPEQTFEGVVLADISIQSVENTSGRTLADYVASTFPAIVGSKQTTAVAGVPAIRFRQSNVTLLETTVVMGEGKFFWLERIAANATSASTYEHVLSTFRFTP